LPHAAGLHIADYLSSFDKLMKKRAKFLVFFFLPALFLACSGQEPDPVKLSLAEPLVSIHGERLVQGLAHCGFCHSLNPLPAEVLSGGRSIVDRHGVVIAPNLTPHSTGLEGWSSAEIVSALRNFRSRDDRDLSVQAHYGYEWLSDKDLFAIVAFLKSLEPVENETVERRISLLRRHTLGLFDRKYEVPGHVPQISPRFKLEYGKYLADHVARCQGCHNSPGGLFSQDGYLQGGMEVVFDGDSKIAPPLTGSGSYLSSWGTEAIIHYLTSAETPDGRKSDALFCPTQFFAKADRDDLEAIASFLNSLD